MIPTATSEVALASIAAGGAVLGALVGGVGSYWVERALSDRRAAAVARAGARVVAADLKHVDGVLGEVEKDGKIWPYHKLPTPGWDTYRNDLALALDPADWKSVSSTVLNIRFFSRGIEEAPTAKAGQPSSVTAKELGPIRSDIADCLRILDRAGGLG